jgi:ribosome-associated protein
MEGDMTSDWVLLDLGDVIVHAMTAQAREYYTLEKLWTVGAEKEI